MKNPNSVTAKKKRTSGWMGYEFLYEVHSEKGQVAVVLEWCRQNEAGSNVTNQ